jgi:hypothetical protein
VADDFIENIINSSCQLAKHRKSNILEVKDVQFHLERNFNLWIPGFSTDDLKPFKKSYASEAHKQVNNLSLLAAVFHSNFVFLLAIATNKKVLQARRDNNQTKGQRLSPTPDHTFFSTSHFVYIQTRHC